MKVKVIDKSKEVQISPESVKVCGVQLKDFYNSFKQLERDVKAKNLAEEKTAKELKRLWDMIK